MILVSLQLEALGAEPQYAEYISKIICTLGNMKVLCTTKDTDTF